MFKAFSALNFPTGNTIPGYSNILFFTFTQGFHDFSNSGFVWEPGAFGCFLVITLMFHFFLNKFRFDKVAIILIIANITTFSTTNYLGLIVLFFMAYRFRSPKVNIYVLLLVPALILAFVFIPFLGDKIVDTYKEDMRDLNRLKVLEKYYHHNRMEIPLNRFSSMVYIYDQFGAKLITGVSNRYNEVLNKSYTVNISNGVFDFLAKFGLIGLLYLLIRYVRFCKPYVLRWENIGYCILILLVLSFGEPILFLPIVMMLLFIQPKQRSLNGPLNDEENESEYAYGRI
ncbi:O-antigen ligase family protein [Mucilaginibacter terrenus]|nr:O-antigen ligase family protein [Mucilaginibacter terrenus]